MIRVLLLKTGERKVHLERRQTCACVRQKVELTLCGLRNVGASVTCTAISQSAETDFRGLLETASQTGDAVEIVPLTPCGSCGGLAPVSGHVARGVTRSACVRGGCFRRSEGARCARPERETGSDPITQIECSAGNGW